MGDLFHRHFQQSIGQLADIGCANGSEIGIDGNHAVPVIAVEHHTAVEDGCKTFDPWLIFVVGQFTGLNHAPHIVDLHLCRFGRLSYLPSRHFVRRQYAGGCLHTVLRGSIHDAFGRFNWCVALALKLLDASTLTRGSRICLRTETIRKLCIICVSRSDRYRLWLSAGHATATNLVQFIAKDGVASAFQTAYCVVFTFDPFGR